MSCFHSYFCYHRSQFLTRRHFNCLPHYPPHFYFMLISFDMAAGQIYSVCDSRTRVAICSQGGLEFNMELAGAISVVCPLRLCSVCTSPFAGRHCLPPPPIGTWKIIQYLALFYVIQISAVSEKVVITGVFTIVIAIRCIIH
jgi:hypothetical protein